MLKPITLGKLIKSLQRYDPESLLFLSPLIHTVMGEDRCCYPDTNFHSYRGYYNNLAVSGSREQIKVGKFLKAAIECIGETFTGYKGGEYKMYKKTPVWVADYSVASSIAITDVMDYGNSVSLILNFIHD